MYPCLVASSVLYFVLSCSVLSGVVFDVVCALSAPSPPSEGA